MNKLDSEIVEGLLREAGYEQASSESSADVILFNTCSVRQHAEDKVYSRVGALRALKEKRNHLVIGILGCMAQKERERIFQRLPHVDLVVGTTEFPRLAAMVEEARQARKHIVATETRSLSGLVRPARAESQAASRNGFQVADAPKSPTCQSHFGDGTPLWRRRAFVACVRGCDNFCSYCVVPYLRGPEESRPPREVLEEVRRLVDAGVREVTLLGQNINSYGRRSGGEYNLASLLEAMNDIEGLSRIRFLTSHPRDLSKEILLAMAALPRVCESLHLPIQSGSDRILQAMRRGYTRLEYLNKVAMARQVVREVTISTDFIVGFPGETEEDFQASARIIREVRFRNCFIFKYSPRPLTSASRLVDDVPRAEKERRNRELLRVQEEVSREENSKLIGKTLEVLVEGPSKKNPAKLTGRSRGDHIVVFEGQSDLVGSLAHVRVKDSTALTLFAEVV